MQFPELLTITSYAGPPVIGAFIGYVTNRIAIKMLFRPLKPWRVAGVRVPMTPGVIPSKRHALADNIGEMVGEHLLTGREVGEAISREPFQVHLDQLVDKQLHSLVGKEFSGMRELVPESYLELFDDSIDSLYHHLSIKLHNWLCTSSGERRLNKSLEDILGQLANQPVENIASLKSRESMYISLGEMISNILSEDRAKDELAQYVLNYLEKSGRNGGTVRDVLPEKSVQTIRMVIEQQTPVLMGQIGSRLGEPPIKSQVVAGILKGVDRFIDSLGPVGSMARGFIDMDSLETTIDNYLDEKEEDIIRWLQQPTVTDEVCSALNKQLDKLFDTPVNELIGDSERRLLALSVCRGVVDRLCTSCAEDNGKDIAVIIRNSFESYLDEGRSSLSSAFGGHKEEGNVQSESSSKMSLEIVNFLQSGQGKDVLLNLIKSSGNSLIENLTGLNGLIPENALGAIKDVITVKANKIILNEVPDLVKSLQINRLVTEKVNSLDLLKLEKLLLSIMEEQFKYINLFGALLGFIIGCINLILIRIV